MITGPATIWTDSSLGTDLTTAGLKRYGGTKTTITNTINKIHVYKDDVLKQMTNNPQIMYGSTLKNIKEIWVGNTKVFGTTTTTQTTGGVPIHYMYYYNGSWKPAQELDSISDVKSYEQYSGDMQYGVYVPYINNACPILYINNNPIYGSNVSFGHSDVYQFTYDGKIIALYNCTNSIIKGPLTTYIGTFPNNNNNINISPQTVAFYNIGTFLNSSSESGYNILSGAYLAFWINAPKTGNTDAKVTLDFTGVNNYQAT